MRDRINRRLVVVGTKAASEVVLNLNGNYGKSIGRQSGIVIRCADCLNRVTESCKEAQRDRKLLSESIEFRRG
jgi:hypothetical protein